MIIKSQHGSNCLNRNRARDRWMNPSPYGNTENKNDECAFSAAYSRMSFSDVMFQSLRSGKSGKNVAWRHPRSKDSVFSMVKSCTRDNTGVIIVPGYGSPTSKQKLKSLNHMDWRDHVGNYRNHNGQQRYYHDTCTYETESKSTYGWGFFQKDSTCCGASIIGCVHPGGHAGNVIGWGGDCGSDCERNYNSDLSIRTDCISAWGLGAAYSSHTGGYGGQSHIGHWWGHGENYMAQYGMAAYVRDVEDMELECMQQ